MNNFTALIIADNQDISRAGLHYLINRSVPHITVKDVSNKHELISEMNECSGMAIVILDYTLFDIHSIDELLVIGKRYNNSRWILFSDELSENIIRRLSAEPTICILLKENTHYIRLFKTLKRRAFSTKTTRRFILFQLIFITILSPVHSRDDTLHHLLLYQKP